MQGITTLYELVAGLTPEQRKELSFLIHALGIRSGGKMHTFIVYDIVCKNSISSDEQLKKLLPPAMKHVVLRHIKARLSQRILDFMLQDSVDADIRLWRLRSEIHIMARLGILGDMMERIEVALVLARQLGLNEDILQLSDQKELIQNLDHVINQDAGGSDGNYSIQPDGDGLPSDAPIPMHYRNSKMVRRNADRLGARNLLKESNTLLLRTLPPFYKSLVLRARLNLCYTVREWHIAASAQSELIDLVYPDCPPGLELLSLHLPQYYESLGLYSLESKNFTMLNKALTGLAFGVKRGGKLLVPFIVSLCRVEFARALRDYGPAVAEKKVTGTIQRLEAEGILRTRELPIPMLSTFAHSAYQSGRYKDAAKFAFLYILASSLRYESLLCYCMMRCISLFECGDFSAMAAAGRDALSRLGKKNMKDMERLFFMTCLKGEKAKSRDKLVAAFTNVKVEIEKGLDEYRYVNLNNSLKIKGWLQKI